MQTVWRTPVELNVAGSGTVSVADPREALDYLTTIWPDQTSELFVDTKAACMQALEGVIDGEACRNLFVAAGQEAGMISLSN